MHQGADIILEDTLKNQIVPQECLGSVAEVIKCVISTKFVTESKKDNKSEVSDKKDDLLTLITAIEDEVKEDVDIDMDVLEDSEEHEDSDPKDIDLDSESHDGIDLSYSFHEEKFLRSRSSYAPVNYEKLWYSSNLEGTFEPDDEYWTFTSVSDSEAEILSTDQAESTLRSIQYATILGTNHDVSAKERKKFDLWIKFNSALFGLFESMYAVTRDVDYKPFA